MQNTLDAFGIALRTARLQRKLTQRALADKLNMSVRTIIEIERFHSNPKFETVVLLAKELNISLDAIVFPDTATANVSKEVCPLIFFVRTPHITGKCYSFTLPVSTAHCGAARRFHH